MSHDHTAWRNLAPYCSRAAGWLPLLVAALILAANNVLPAADDVQVKPGDRVVFLGDSITQQGAGPEGYVTLVRQALSGPEGVPDVEVIGAGISGNRVPNLLDRLERDVLAQKPSLVVVYIGINDVWHSLSGRGTPKDEYEAGLRKLVAAVQQSGARVLMCTPSVIGEKTDGSNRLDMMLDEYAQVSRKVAADSGAGLLDLRHEFLGFLTQQNPNQEERGHLTTDGVHLNKAGNRFVADQVLRVLRPVAADRSDGSRLLRHVVLFKFQDNVSEPQVQEVVDAFRTLPQKIDVIHEFEWGTDISTEQRAEGFTHCFLVTFRSAEDRDAYLPHPMHQQFVALAKPRLEKVLVVDYWTRR